MKTIIPSLILCVYGAVVPQAGAMRGMGFNSLAGWPEVGTLTDMRIWDIGVTWRDIHLGVDVYDFSQLDVVVNQMASFGVRITYVVGATPQVRPNFLSPCHSSDCDTLLV